MMNQQFCYILQMIPEKQLENSDEQDPQKVSYGWLKLSDFNHFLKTCQQPQAQTLKIVNIEIGKYSDEQIETVQLSQLNSYNSLCCTKQQLINLVCRMVISNQPKQKQDHVVHSIFSKNEGPKSKWSQVVEELSTQIAIRYHPVSYHNFTHGFELMKMMFLSFEKSPTIKNIFNYEQITFIMLAALAHDINHKGLNNSYHAQMQTDLAKSADNEGILQKMHAHTFLNIFKERPDLDILSFSQNQQANRQLILRLILATDMGEHAHHLDLLTQKNLNGSFHIESKQDSMILMENLFHACDINSACHSDFQQFTNWSGLLAYEFDQQTKIEKKNNLKISQFMVFKGYTDFWKGQAIFVENIVYPLWKQISITIPTLQYCVVNICKNLQAAKEKVKSDKNN